MDRRIRQFHGADRLRFAISGGYRYVDSGKTKIDLVDAVGIDRGNDSLGMQSHEVTLALRVHFFSLSWPRRSSRSVGW